MCSSYRKYSLSDPKIVVIVYLNSSLFYFETVVAWECQSNLILEGVVVIKFTLLLLNLHLLIY